MTVDSCMPVIPSADLKKSLQLIRSVLEAIGNVELC